MQDQISDCVLVFSVASPKLFAGQFGNTGFQAAELGFELRCGNSKNSDAIGMVSDFSILNAMRELRRQECRRGGLERPLHFMLAALHLYSSFVLSESPRVSLGEADR